MWDRLEIIMKRLPFTLMAVLASVATSSAQTARRPLSLDDLGTLKEVRDPQCAPDGKSVAFVVSQIDVKDDKPGSSHIWTIGLDGRNERQITSSSTRHGTLVTPEPVVTAPDVANAVPATAP